MSKVRLYGDTSGFVDLKAPDVAGDVTITLPNTTGPFATETYVDDEIAAIPAIAGIGSNVVQTVKTNVFSTTAASYTEVTGLTVTISPTSSSSKVLVIVSAPFSYSATASAGGASIFRGATNLSTATTAGSRIPGIQNFYADNIQQNNMMAFSFLDSPATTSATTYSVRAYGSGATLYVGRTPNDVDSVQTIRGISSITAIEVAA